MLAIKRLSTVDADFKAKMDALLAFEAAADEGIERTVAGILADVKARGDAAVVEYSNKFDRLSVGSMADLELSQAEMQQALDSLPADRRAALEAAAGRVRAYHERQRLDGWSYTEADGTMLDQHILAGHADVGGAVLDVSRHIGGADNHDAHIWMIGFNDEFARCFRVFAGHDTRCRQQWEGFAENTTLGKGDSDAVHGRLSWEKRNFKSISRVNEQKPGEPGFFVTD